MALHLSVNPHTKFLISLILFLALNISLYSFIFFFHGRVPFNRINYTYNSHHFLEDPRIKGGEFNLINALGQYDAQWYLKIAQEGYPKNPKNKDVDSFRGAPDVLTYAFFPFYPTLLSITNYAFDNMELTAFVLSNVLMIITFGSLYFVLTKLFNEGVAIKTSFLTFLFPFSIFFRSYFTEGIFLFLLIWFSYFLIKKSFSVSSLLLGLLAITRPNGLFLFLPFLYFLTKNVREKRAYERLLPAITFAFIPLFIWFLYNYIQTGNFLYFYNVQAYWYERRNLFSSLIENIETLFSFWSLPFHLFHRSKIDVFMAVSGILILLVSRKRLPSELWWISFSLLFTPLLTKDLMSYSRYQSVVYPLFLYLAIVMRPKVYALLCIIFLILLFMASLYFVNWWWIG